MPGRGTGHTSRGSRFLRNVIVLLEKGQRTTVMLGDLGDMAKLIKHFGQIKETLARRQAELARST